MKTISLLNVYGEKNIGDEAIFSSALKIINNATKGNDRVFVQCHDISSLSKQKSGIKIIPLEVPYAHAIQSKSKKVTSIVKVLRFFEIITLSIVIASYGKIFPQFLPKKGFYSYITATNSSDLVIGMGGGYLITKESIGDIFGLFLTLLPIAIAKFYNKPIIMLPMSFGPFAAKWHGTLTAKLLANTTFFYREHISKRLLETFDTHNKIVKKFSPDLAFLLKPNKLHISRNEKYIVLTAREWLNNNDQAKYEKVLVELILKMWQQYKIRTIFIPMAYNKIEDDDNLVAKRINSYLTKDIPFEVKNITSHVEVQEIASQALFSICTRMHSAILSSTVGTPFITIGYGHKGKGVMNDLGLEDWYIDIKKINNESLSTLINNLMNTSKRKLIKDKVSKKIELYSTYEIPLENAIRSLL